MEIRTLEPLTAEQLAENAMTIHRAMAVCRAHGFKPVAVYTLVAEREELERLRVASKQTALPLSVCSEQARTSSADPYAWAAETIAAVTAERDEARGLANEARRDAGAHCERANGAELALLEISDAIGIDPDEEPSNARLVAEIKKIEAGLNTIAGDLGLDDGATVEEMVAEVQAGEKNAEGMLEVLRDRDAEIAWLTRGADRLSDERDEARAAVDAICTALGLDDEATWAEAVVEIERLRDEIKSQASAFPQPRREIYALRSEHADVCEALGLGVEASAADIVESIDRLRATLATVDATARRIVREVREPRTRAAILADLDAAMAEGGCEGVALARAVLDTLRAYGDPSFDAPRFGDAVYAWKAAGCPLASEEVRGG